MIFSFFLNALFASIFLAERMSAEDQEKLDLVLFNPKMMVFILQLNRHQPIDTISSGLLCQQSKGKVIRSACIEFIQTFFEKLIV